MADPTDRYADVMASAMDGIESTVEPAPGPVSLDELIQIGADALRARACALLGRPNVPAAPDGVLAEHVRPVVTAVWERVREDLAEAEQLRAELDDLAAQNAKTESNFEEFAEVIVPERNDLARQVERLRAELETFHEDAKQLRTELVRLAEQREAAVRAWKTEHAALDRVTGELKEAEQRADHAEKAHDEVLRTADDLRHRLGLAETERDELRRRAEHVTEVGSDSTVQAASWSCTCGASRVITYARPGMGEVVALRLARLYAARHESGQEPTP